MAKPTVSSTADEIDPLARLRRSFSLAIVIVFPIVALAYWLVFVAGPDTASAGSTQGPSPQATQPDLARVADSELDGLLASALEAESRFDVVAPHDANAVEIYLRILRSFPEEPRARMALNDLLPIALNLAEVEIRDGQLEEAQRVISLLELAYSNSRSLNTLRTRLDDRLIQGEQQRVAEEESARRSAQQALTEREVADSLDADSGVAQQEPLVVEAVAVDPPSTVALLAFEDAADTATGPVSASAAEQAVSDPGPLPAAIASVSGRHEVAPMAAPGPEALRVVEEVAANYPPVAMRRGIEGWVEVEFLVRPDGSVHEVSVINAEPQRIFDTEAVRAVSRWRFEPFGVDSIEGIRARKTLQFSLSAGN